MIRVLKKLIGDRMIEWDYYWTIKQTFLHNGYDRIAGVYRKAVIKPHLEKYVTRYFNKNSLIFHAGCGGGQVEEEIADSYTIVGMDISLNAIELYKKYHTDPKLILGDINQIGIKTGSLDGIYNLGVMEHFKEDEINTILLEFRRVLKNNGVIIMFWPPEYGSTVIFFKFVHFFLNSVLRRDIHFQPPEPSRIRSKKWVETLLKKSGFTIIETSFGIEDFFTNMVVVIKKTDNFAVQ
jgi:ubiquinone/menaquinone biosynthesis C-methylase UbiE